MQWMAMLGGKENESFIDTLMRALKDPTSGLGKEQRAEIEKFIGGLSEKVPGGYFAYSLKTLGETGKIPVKDSDGEYQMIEPSGDQKIQMLNLLSDTTMDPKAKHERIENLIRSIGIDSQTNIGTAVDKGIDAVTKTGSMDAALGVFTASLTKSLYTYVGSRTEDAVRAALLNAEPGNAAFTEKGWAALTPDQRQSLMHSVLTTRPEIVNKIKSDVKTKQVNDNIQAREKINNSITKTDQSLAQIDRMLDDDKDGDGFLDVSKDKNGQPIPAGSSGTLMGQQRSLAAIPQKLTTNLANNAYQSMTQGIQTLVPAMSAKISQVPWFRERIAKGYLPASFVDTAAQLYAYQRTLQNMTKAYPRIAAMITPPNFPADITALLMRAGPSQTTETRTDHKGLMSQDFYVYSPASTADMEAPAKLLADIRNRMNTAFPLGNPSEELMQGAKQEFERLNGFATQMKDDKNFSVSGAVSPEQSALVASLAEWQKAVQDNKKNIQTTKDQRGVLIGTRDKLAQFQEQLDVPVFNPDELLSQVLGFAEGAEDVFAGRVPTAIEKALGNLKPEDIAALAPQLGDMFGVNPATMTSNLPDTFKNLAQAAKPQGTAPVSTMPATSGNAGTPPATMVATPGTVGTSPTATPATSSSSDIQKWQQFQGLLKQLGLDTTGWSMIGGIPHIRMGDGKFMPFNQIPMETSQTGYVAPTNQTLLEGTGTINPALINLSSTGTDPNLDSFVQYTDNLTPVERSWLDKALGGVYNAGKYVGGVAEEALNVNSTIDPLTGGLLDVTRGARKNPATLLVSTPAVALASTARAGEHILAPQKAVAKVGGAAKKLAKKMKWR